MLPPKKNTGALSINIGDLISIYANKKNILQNEKKERVIEAIGNVVVIHGPETIYGDVATFNEATMEFVVTGNVRMITPDYNLFASKASFVQVPGQNETKLVLENSKLFAATFALVADRIEKSAGNIYWARMAEFSTCKDCPESWSVFGKRIKIERGEYVTIYDGMIKVKGSEFVYLPIFIFPIKKERETGFLFPKIFYRRNDGLTYAQPFFWAISDDKDATLTPLIMLKRGEGMRWEYRQALNNKSQLQLQGLSTFDHIYLPNKENFSESNKQFFRNYTDFEWGHQFNSRWKHQVNVQNLRDLDMIRDFPIYLQNNFQGPYMGIDGFVEYQGDRWLGSLYASQKQTLLTGDEFKYKSFGDSDNATVNIKPRLSLSQMPSVLDHWNFPVLNRSLFYVNTDYAVFRQDRSGDDSLVALRNAERVNIAPNLKLSLFENGVIHLNSEVKSDWQVYHFSTDPKVENAHKYANTLRTGLNFSIEKVYGLAYTDYGPPSEEDERLKNENEIKVSDSNSPPLISEMPPFSLESTEKKVAYPRSSYKHKHDIHLIHHFLLSDEEYGNPNFWSQVNRSVSGRFDANDSVRRREFRDLTENSRTLIPPANTLELQWNQNVVKKSAKLPDVFVDNSYLLDQFDYGQIFAFNVSQGFDFDEYERTKNSESALTRLASTISMNTSKYWNIGVADYFFHQENKHIVNGSLVTGVSIVSLTQGINYNGFNFSKSYRFDLGVKPNDVIRIAYGFERDLGSKLNISSNTSVAYQPTNKCWAIELGYFKTVQERRFTFDFVVNFGNAGQRSFF